MRLSWNEIRARAAAFAEEWKDEGYERGEAQTFYNDFFQISCDAFGRRPRPPACNYLSLIRTNPLPRGLMRPSSQASLSASAL